MVLACVVVIIAGARAASPLLVPFLLAIFMAIIFDSPVRALKAKGLPAWLSVCVVAVALLSLFAFMFMVLGSSAETFSAALPGYQAQFEALLNEAVSKLSAQGVEVNAEAISAALDPGKAVGFFANFLGGVGETLSNIMLILFTVVFILVDASTFPAKLAAHDDRGLGDSLAAVRGLAQSMNEYIVTKAQVSLLTGVLVWLGLVLMGVEFAALWGFLAFLLNFVPTIGSIIAAVPVLLLSLLEMDPGLTLMIAALYLAVNVLIGNVIEPTIMGERVGLSTLTVFASLVFWGWMFGPVGMLLSVPLTMVFKTLAEQNPETQWLAILLSSAPPALADSEGEDMNADERR